MKTKNLLTTTLLLFGLLLFAACDGGVGSSGEVKEPPPFPAGEEIPEDLIIRLKRTPCYGECPAYMLTVKADGEVRFFGQQDTQVKGEAGGRISTDKVRQLIREFEKAKFFDLDDNYTSENCATDHPTVRTTLLINGRVKKIEHDTGCKAPDALTELENRIDEIVGTERWIGKSK